MEKIDGNIRSVRGRFATFMVNKPMWAFWTLYTVFSGAIFAAMYGAVRVLAQQWWVAAISIVVAGLVWGTSKFSIAKSIRQSEEQAKSQNTGQ